jgi:nucleoside phosphorylase
LFFTFEGSVVVVVVVVGSIAATTAAFSSFPVPSWVSAMTASSLKKEKNVTKLTKNQEK